MISELVFIFAICYFILDLHVIYEHFTQLWYDSPGYFCSKAAWLYKQYFETLSL